MSQYKYNTPPEIKFPKKILFLIPVLILFIIIIKSAVTINAGEAGVLFKTLSGGVDVDNPPLGEGFHIIAPWNKVIRYNVKKQEVLEVMDFLSSNGLAMSMEASIIYRPNKAGLGNLHQDIGPDYLESIIKPQVRSIARSVAGRYTPEEIYSTKRETIKTEIKTEAEQKLRESNILLVDFLVRDIALPPTIKGAIEEKLKFEQESLGYKYKLEKATKEAERKRIEAQGIKDFQDIVSDGISDKLLRWKGIEATLELAKSPGSKVVIVGSGDDGLPLILGNN